MPKPNVVLVDRENVDKLLASGQQDVLVFKWRGAIGYGVVYPADLPEVMKQILDKISVGQLNKPNLPSSAVGITVSASSDVAALNYVTKSLKPS